ncbi:MAG: hypothetical protein ABI859_08200, partial [Pseudomonadota bacterium]
MAEKIQVEIVGKSSSLEAAMARASGSVKEHVGQIQGSLQGAKDGIDRVGASLSTAFELTGLAVAAAAVGMISQKLIAMGERAIEIRNMSAVLQVTGLQFQAMGEAAEEAGIGTSKLFSATEKLVQLLAEARAGSHAAMDTLFAMGVTLGQIQDPGFGTADMLAHLSSRLNNSATATSTMLALTKEFGGRAALAAQAIKALASDTADWHIEADKINALSDEQTKHLQKMGLEWKDMGQYIENATAKLLVWIDTHPVLTM